MLTISMFYHGNNSYTCFTGKASESLSLLYVVHEVCIEVSTGSARDTHRIACCESLCRLFTICKDHGYVLPRADADMLLESCETFLVHYNWLTSFSAKCGLLNYNLVTKRHMIWHICHQGRFLNPRVGWCFEFEDYVGVVVRCAKGSMHGSSLAIVGRKCLENFLLLLQLSLRD